MTEYSPLKRRLLEIWKNLEIESSKGLIRAIEIARTGFWFERLRHSTNSKTSYALGKFLQPESYGKRKKTGESDDSNALASPETKLSKKSVSEPKYHDNLWRRYACGEVVPSSELIDLVDKKVLGSKANFHHSLFDELNTEQPIGRNGTERLKKLHPAVQRAVFENDALAAGIYRRRKGMGRTLGWLERCGSMDAMAATIILLREALEQDDHEAAYKIAQSLFRISIIAFTVGPGICVRFEIATLLSILIFPLVTSHGRIYTASTKHYWDCFDLLSRTLRRMEDRYQIGVSDVDTRNAAWKIIRGDYGDDLRWALNSPTAIEAENKEPSIAMRNAVLRDQVFSTWAWKSIRSGETVTFLPSTVLDQLKQDQDRFVSEYA